MSVGLIILAAGASTRLGEPKQLLKFGGKTFLRRAAEIALASGCRPVIVVLGANDNLLKSEITDLPLEMVVNKNWSDGMSASIKCGLERYLESEPAGDAVLLMLCDQPLITPETIVKLVEVYRQNQKLIVACEYNGVNGVPVLFARPVFNELLHLSGEEGAKSIIKKYSAENVASISVAEAAFDVDTPEDYKNLCKTC